jgi:DNA repair protein RadC
MNNNKNDSTQSQYAFWEIKKIKNPSYKHMPMSGWCKDDQPRYKMLSKGKGSLSDAETLCVILGAGSSNDTSLDLAKKILLSANNNLAEVSKLGLADLTRIKGIGQAKALSIIAAFELGRRRNICEVIKKNKITNSRDAFEIFRSELGDLPYEEFWIILLNKANKVIRKCSISEGGVSGTVVDPKKIFKIALDHHASSIILGHNHPSGNIQPSDADRKITDKIKNAGVMLDIAVLDHIILGNDQYYSFADEGML